MDEKKGKIIKYVDYRGDGTIKEMIMPQMTKYEFLLERNKPYMNYNAISFEGMKKKITYEELHDKIWKYARALYKKGIRKGDLIGFCAGNTPDAIYIMYALDVIGAITVGLSPLNNAQQMRRDIEMIRPQRVITLDMLYGNLKNALEEFNISPILYSPFESLEGPVMKNLGIDNLEQCSYNPDYVSDIMFTGGSTGIHRGTELYGNAFNALAKATDAVYILEPGQVHLGNIPVNHMVFGKFTTHYALTHNLEYALTMKMLPKDFAAEVIRTQAAGITGGPIHFENFIDNSLIKEGSLKNVVQATAGGEHFKPKQKIKAEEALRKGGSKAIIANAMGATETTSLSMVSFVDTRKYTDLNAYPFNIDYEKKPITCGHPLPGVRCKIVDPDTLQEVEKGQPGICLISGVSIMKGYYNNPEENKKIFIIDEDGTKWYNSGDIMKYAGDDLEELTFSGRKKRNFVCNVSNIYPEEIEAMLLEFDEVKEAVVTGVPDAKYQFLPSYHISLSYECDTELLTKKIEDKIEFELGVDALPGYISFTIEPLPKTDNGKFNSTLIAQQDLASLKDNNLRLVRKNY